MFSNLFSYEKTEPNISTTEASFKFFYFRSSPRGNSKFGVMDVPWQRLRMQQQGTDEEIQFDHIWLARSTQGIEPVKAIEDRLKLFYKEYCLAEKNQRAGHTEWFFNIDPITFEEKLLNLAKMFDIEIKKIFLKEPYRATKRSQCRFNFPKSYDYIWYEQLWLRISQ